jgi:hypothetical protein
MENLERLKSEGDLDSFIFLELSQEAIMASLRTSEERAHLARRPPFGKAGETV